MESGYVMYGEIKELPDNSNRVTLCGRLVSRYERGDVICATISVMERGRKKEIINYPKVYFFHGDHTGIENLFVGDEVYMTGHIASPRKRRQSGDSYISYAVVGDMIRKREAINSMDRGYWWDGYMEPQCNRIYVHGALKDTIRYPGGRIGVVILAKDGRGKIGTVELSAFRNDSLFYPIGAMVTAQGRAESRVKIAEGERTKHFQNYVLTRLAPDKPIKKNTEDTGKQGA